MESQIIANILDNSRKLTKMYINRLKDTDLHRQFCVEGVTLNSAFSIIAHLAWAENALVLESVGGRKSEISWLESYALGSEFRAENEPTLEEVTTAFEAIHAESLELIRSFSDEELGEPVKMTRINNSTKRSLLYHTIRHEGIHAGQLSWICRLNGIKII